MNPQSSNPKPIETAMMALGLANQMWLIHHPLGYYMCIYVVVDSILFPLCISPSLAPSVLTYVL